MRQHFDLMFIVEPCAQPFDKKKILTRGLSKYHGLISMWFHRINLLNMFTWFLPIVFATFGCVCTCEKWKCVCSDQEMMLKERNLFTYVIQNWKRQLKEQKFLSCIEVVWATPVSYCVCLCASIESPFGCIFASETNEQKIYKCFSVRMCNSKLKWKQKPQLIIWPPAHFPHCGTQQWNNPLKCLHICWFFLNSGIHQKTTSVPPEHGLDANFDSSQRVWSNSKPKFMKYSLFCKYWNSFFSSGKHFDWFLKNVSIFSHGIESCTCFQRFLCQTSTRIVNKNSIKCVSGVFKCR